MHSFLRIISRKHHELCYSKHGERLRTKEDAHRQQQCVCGYGEDWELGKLKEV